MKNITFLGPVGATFSHDAYDILAEIYGAPKTECSGPEINCIPASNNREVLGLIAKHGGYGALAMETLAEGRVAEPLESFIELLGPYGNEKPCPFHLVGSIKLKLHFCLMARKEVSAKLINRIIAHPKALGACKMRVASMGVPTMDASSNGEAARLIAESNDHAFSAALGPRSASQKYGLQVLAQEYEDQEAITTFFLVAPKEHKVSIGKKNRVLIVFKVPHKPGSLVRALQSFEQENLNLIQIHSVHAGNLTYNFAIEIDVEEGSLNAFKRARQTFESCVEKHLTFGPFEVLSK